MQVLAYIAYLAALTFIAWGIYGLSGWIMAKVKKKQAHHATPKPKVKPPAVPPDWAISLNDRLAELKTQFDRIEGQLNKENNIANVLADDLNEFRDEVNNRLDLLFNAANQPREWRGLIELQEHTPK